MIATIGYRLKLPHAKDFIIVSSDHVIQVKSFLQYEGKVYYVKRVYFANNRDAGGHLIEVEETNETNNNFVNVRKSLR
ncbi:hypothetical protein OB236_38935 [Paenibacillus sp. WQ 127069]|uniref:Uncharacterized protein n=1 Tax=Paenibacillus baimaensis TaxID=2982185 RepID=A0ABT2UU00_9BACL|nr:hypothetical protein [Paenibacillus sp. WQ 127069]MCU6798119.1 hypothetical protein [Paenibacillus sp. WQ 127069]